MLHCSGATYIDHKYEVLFLLYPLRSWLFSQHVGRVYNDAIPARSTFRVRDDRDGYLSVLIPMPSDAQRVYGVR